MHARSERGICGREPPAAARPFDAAEDSRPWVGEVELAILAGKGGGMIAIVARLRECSVRDAAELINSRTGAIPVNVTVQRTSPRFTKPPRHSLNMFPPYAIPKNQTHRKSRSLYIKLDEAVICAALDEIRAQCETFLGHLGEWEQSNVDDRGTPPCRPAAMSASGAERKGRHGSLPAAIWGSPENKSPISRVYPYYPQWIK